MLYLDPRRAVRLRNNTCPYCGRELDRASSSVEHTIGRRFVPKGKLHQSWNLVLNACMPCNAQKGELEDDLGALSMQPDAFGVHISDDPEVRKEVARKGSGSRSRRTQRSVGESQETKKLDMRLGAGLDLSVSFLMRPQIDLERAADLARMQLAACFYWLTYDESNRRGGFWPGGALIIDTAFRADWGNSLQVGFMKGSASWHDRLLVVAADEYFKISIRRRPDAVCWSWALEWNRSFRLVGLFGDPVPIEEFASRLEAPMSTLLTRTGPNSTRMRREVALDDDSDLLFQPSTAA